jgi:NAD(P)-dependent dehydrogenase (short-subunit alcohol dehydrogenase family)
MSELTGKSALVTGAGRGIGRATVERLAAAGAKVTLAAQSAHEIERLAEEIRGRGGEVEAVVTDVADYAAVTETVAHMERCFGHIDILINNAGIIEPIAPLAESDPEIWERCIAVNLVGAYHVVRAVLPSMIAAGEGVVVNVSSGAASHALEGWSGYCAAKAGLAMLTRSLALELEGSGVRVYGFRPGTVNTGMQAVIRASGMGEIARMRPEDHPPPEDPARVMVWLCGAAAAGLNGRELDVRDPELRRAAGLAA